MGKNRFFQFKQFRVVQEQSAMKVGIDGVLFGAWADISHAKRVLDIGTGTGLLALIAAQRSEAEIDAVEVDPDAAGEALFNFRNSPWNARLRVFACAFQEFSATGPYDHILSNPPFFDPSPLPTDAKRARARHSGSLGLEELLHKSAQLLTGKGKISLILPADRTSSLRFSAHDAKLCISRLETVAPDETKKPHRILVELSKEPLPETNGAVFIRNAGSGEYSDQYRQLTRDFYLAF